MSKVKEAVDAAGGAKQMAERMGVTVQFVYQMCRGERPVPATRCADIERACGGVVTCRDLRPDVFGKQSSAA